MPEQLSNDQLNNLYSIAHSGAADALQQYYSVLAGYGYPYGNLGLSLASKENFAGQGAVCYLQSMSNILGKPLVDDQVREISVELMQADIGARIAKFSAAGNRRGGAVRADWRWPLPQPGNRPCRARRSPAHRPRSPSRCAVRR